MARAALEEARERIAALVGARPRQVVLTSGGTESVNAAVFGTLSEDPGPVALAAVEHSSVRDASVRLGPVVAIAVDGVGRIEPAAVDEALTRCRNDHGRLPALVHCQWANHEVGTVQPVVAVVARCRELGVPVHVDAVVAAGHLPVDLDALGADLVSISAHKLGGPPGIGALVLRRGLRIEPADPGRRGTGAGPAGGPREPHRCDRVRGCDRSPRHRPGGSTTRPRPLGVGPSAWPRRPWRSTAWCASERPTTGSATSSASASRASRRSRSSWDWTRPGSPCTPDRRARRSRSSPHRCSRQWGSTASGHCASRSAGRPPTTTWRPSQPPFPRWWAGSGRSAEPWSRPAAAPSGRAGSGRRHLGREGDTRPAVGSVL